MNKKLQYLARFSTRYLKISEDLNAFSLVIFRNNETHFQGSYFSQGSYFRDCDPNFFKKIKNKIHVDMYWFYWNLWNFKTCTHIILWLILFMVYCCHGSFLHNEIFGELYINHILALLEAHIGHMHCSHGKCTIYPPCSPLPLQGSHASSNALAMFTHILTLVWLTILCLLLISWSWVVILTGEPITVSIVNI